MVCGPIHLYPNEDIKVFNEHQVNDHLYTLLLSMPGGNAPAIVTEYILYAQMGTNGAYVLGTNICVYIYTYILGILLTYGIKFGPLPQAHVL